MTRRQNKFVIHESTMELYAGDHKRWRHDPCTEWVSVEQAALNHFIQEGWSGDAGEGKVVLSLIKAASFTVLPAALHSRFVESIYRAHPGFIDIREHSIKLGIDPESPASSLVNAFNQERRAEAISVSDMIANILTASEQRIADNFNIMTGPRSHTLSFFPTLSLQSVLGLYAALGNKRISQIAMIFGKAPYLLRSGWPDLTLWRESTVVFKEIKAPGDRYRGNQIQTAEVVLFPLGFDVEIVRVVPKPDIPRER